jgi:hypothetical protein
MGSQLNNNVANVPTVWPDLVILIRDFSDFFGNWKFLVIFLVIFLKETMSTTMHLFTFYLESDGMSTNNDYKHFFGALSLQFC